MRFCQLYFNKARKKKDERRVERMVSWNVYISRYLKEGKEKDYWQL